MLAQQLHLSDRAIQRWEKAERIPNAENVIVLALYFDVTADYLLGLEN